MVVVVLVVIAIVVVAVAVEVGVISGAVVENIFHIEGISLMAECIRRHCRLSTDQVNQGTISK